MLNIFLCTCGPFGCLLWKKCLFSSSYVLTELFFVVVVIELYEFFICCCLVVKLGLTLCDLMDCSTSGFPILYYLPSRVCSNSCPLSRWCHPTISFSVTSFFSCPQSFPASGSFPMTWLFMSGGQSVGASASASVLSMNIQGWFPLGFTGLISLQSKRLSRAFSNTTVQKHQFFGAQIFFMVQLSPSLHDYLLEKS